MTRREGSDDLSQLLSLVERNQEQTDGGYPDEEHHQHGTGQTWTSNHDFWVEQLKHETGGEWPEHQYTDAANLINLSEYQRAVLKDFVQVLKARDIDSGATAGRDADTVSTDQVFLRDGFGSPPPADEDRDEHSTRAGDPVSQSTGDGSTAPRDHHSGREDHTAVSAVRSREPGSAQFNQIRADLYVQTGLASLRPYDSWSDFQDHNKLPDKLIADLETAYPDGFDAVDLWVAGLAEVSGSGVEGSTLQAVANTETGRILIPPANNEVNYLAALQVTGEIEHSYASNMLRHAGSSLIENSVTPDLNDLTSHNTRSFTLNSGGLTVHGSAGDDVLYGGADDDTIYAGAGDDTVEAGAGNDLIYGGKGNDRLSGGRGQDNVKGGAGDDTLSGDEGDDTLDGGNGSDDISGGDGTDIAAGGYGDDHLYGDAGNDTLDGEEGADIMAGGLGNDTIYIDDQHDQAIEALGEGTDTALVNIEVYSLPENVEILIYIGEADFIGTGNDLANIIVGGDGQDTLDGGMGDDVLDGGYGADLLIGGLGSDVIVVNDCQDIVIEGEGEGIDTVTTNLSEYSLSDNVEILVYTGGGEFQGSGNDLGNIIIGGNLNDLIEGGDGNDSLYGGYGNDHLDGGDGDNYLDGGDGDDYVTDNQGNDYVLFTRGNDTLILRPGFGNDVVIGFDTESSGSEGRDRIDVSAYGFNESSLGVDILLIYDGESTLVKIGADSVKLVLVDAHTMDRQDFIFS